MLGLVNVVSLEKAILEIIDRRGSAVVLTDADKAAKTKALGSFAAGMSGKILDAADSIPGLSDTISKVKGLDSLGSDSIKKRIEVQFNPSELSFTAYGGRRSTIITETVPKEQDGVASDAEDLGEGGSDKQKASKGVKESKSAPNGEKPPRMEMRVPLIFDNMNNADAFVFASNELNLYGVGSTVKNAITSAMGQKYTVQPQVEGLLAALRCANTRNVNFCWGKMLYSGVLNSVNVNYTMFSRAGRPIRARVELSILLCDSILSDPSKSVWHERYMTAFGKGDFSDYSSSTVKTGTLLNFSK